MIFHKYVHIGIRNNHAEGILEITFINTIYHLLSAKNDFFCEQSTKNMMQNGTHLIFMETSTHIMDNLQVLGFSLIST